MLTLGVVETSNALMSQHVITKMAREGSNMISRETRLTDAGAALQHELRPGNLQQHDQGDLLGAHAEPDRIQQWVARPLSEAPGRQSVASGQPAERQRHVPGRERLHGANPNNNAGLRVTNAPAGIAWVPGGMIYVTEVYTTYTPMTPLSNFGITMPVGVVFDRVFLMFRRLRVGLSRARSGRSRTPAVHSFSKGRTDMTRHRNALTNEKGFALFYMAVFLTLLCIFVGLAVDTGRAYVVQAQLSKAVDGAALGAARMLNSADPRQQAATIYRANFPNGWMATTSSTNPGDAGFYQLETVPATGQNIVTINATAVVPTTFMKLANFQELTVHATGQATRRMVDLSLVLDVSGSIGWRWPYVRDAARTFVDSFDAASDRISLIFYSNGGRVVDAMPAGRGFDKARVMADIPNGLPGGSTNMAEGMYRGWDEVRSVPNGQQSGLRVIVFFTDGATNGLPGIYPGWLLPGL